jgi:hypothetical protein
MKFYIKILIFLFLLTGTFIAQPVYDLQFIPITMNGTNFDVKVQIKGTPNFGLGSTNIKFNFNNTDLSSPSLLTAHNFSGADYNNITVTEPVAGVASINIELFNTSAGSVISTLWIDVATVRFTTVNSSGNSQLSFRTTSATTDPTIAFADNQSTVVVQGTFSPLNVNLLPVELTSFTVNSLEGTKAKLQWETASEVNNYGFEIERSQTSDIKSQYWQKIGFVQGNGNSNSPKSYSFTDNNLIGGSKFSYRLKQIDNDGRFEYSDAVEVEVVPDKYELYQNYPNPFNPTTNIKFALVKDSRVKINIYDLLGAKVAELVNKDFTAGFHQIEFNASREGLASGIYLYSIETKDFKSVKKMVMMK